MRRDYSQDFRDNAVALAVRLGNAKLAAEMVGVDEKTVQRWVQAIPSEPARWRCGCGGMTILGHTCACGHPSPPRVQ